MENHTPGPWTIDEKEHGRRQVITAKRGVVAELANYGRADGINAACFIEELKANARLIASAPELLDCLMSSVVFMEGVPMSCGCAESLSLIEKARAIIAQAKGE
jgi:hypothetical protein